jgi:nucleotide-binding universal stress UspA family protein
MSGEQRAVLVGVDESPGADAALRWAIDDSRARHAPLRVVCAYRWAPGYGRIPTHLKTPEPDVENNRRFAAHLVATAVEQVALLATDAQVSGEAVDGNPVPVLIEESAEAAVLVLGSRHLEAFGSAVLGSVGAGVAARATCPVVVVRGPAGDPDEHAAVVVGVDGADSSQTVLEFAFGHASRHRVALHAVLCWRPDLLASMQWRPEPPPPERAQAWLAEAMAGWQEMYPDVVVHSAVIRDHPVSGLIAESAAQYLLVVGGRGHHALTGTLLGSVSQGVLHHATCPVAVVPTHAG